MNNSQNRINLFEIYGIQVSIHYSWFFIFILILWTLSSRIFPENFPGMDKIVYFIMAVPTTILLFASLFAHELSHSMVAKKNGLEVKNIMFFLFGAVAELSGEPDNPKLELKVALAGPAVSFILAVTFLILGVITIPLVLISKIFLAVAAINAFWGIFNLVPAFPLDGGRVLRALVWMRTGDYMQSLKIAIPVSKFFALLFIMVGFFSVVSGTFMNGLWLILLGMLLWHLSSVSYERAAKSERVFSDTEKTYDYSAATIKAWIRHEMLRRRKSIDEQTSSYKSSLIGEMLKSLDEYVNTRSIMFYASVDKEVITFPMIEQALRDGKEISLPKVDTQRREIRIYKIEDVNQLVRGSYGILEPDPQKCRSASLKDIDIIIVPGVAFDLNLNRIGFGKGYYDALLKNTKALKVALAYDFQVVSEIPASSHDVKMDVIITELRVYRDMGTITDKIDFGS